MYQSMLCGVSALLCLYELYVCMPEILNVKHFYIIINDKEGIGVAKSDEDFCMVLYLDLFPTKTANVVAYRTQF